LLATLILYVGGYDLKGFYSLEEYYARDLPSYYNALVVGQSHNYYMGRAEADITGWVEYFIVGMAESFESVQRRAKKEARAGKTDQSQILRQLDIRQRKVLEHFSEADSITAIQIEKLLKLKARTVRHLCKSWVDSGFLLVIDSSKKARKYTLNIVLGK